MFSVFNYIVSVILNLALLVGIFHQKFTVHKLGLGPHPYLGKECENSLEKEKHDISSRWTLALKRERQ